MSEQSLVGKNILVLGGSGFISGTLVRSALASGCHVWTLTRGHGTEDDGVINLHADRNDDPSFLAALQSAGTVWDAVIDCICMRPEHARQDIAVFGALAKQLVVLSTDFVFDPGHIRTPQNEESDFYTSVGYGGAKRLCELEFLSCGCAGPKWTILRTGHVYGPGSKLGSFPMHSRDDRLIEKLLAGEEMALAGGGRFLQHPHYAPDLVNVMLGCVGNERALGQIFMTGGPEIIEARQYFATLADMLGVPLRIRDVPVEQCLAERPDYRPFFCDRSYDLSKAREAGLPVSSTPFKAGLRAHLDSVPGGRE